MATLTYAQLEQLWISNGGSRATAPLAAAIAMAESSGRTEVTSPNPDGGTNVGPWQIDTRGVGAGLSVAQLQDPNTNAQAAIKGSSGGTNWSDWATWASGAYKKFLKGNVPPGAQLTSTTPSQQQGQQGLNDWLSWIPGFGIPLQFMTGAATGTADVASAIAETGRVISELVTWVSWLFVPSHWIRIICFILGVPLVGIGITVMVVGTKPIPVSVGPVSTQVSGGSIAPAMGILEVTAGSILLFIAFHNLPDNVQTFPQLLSHMQSKVQTGVTSKEGPGPKPPVVI